jgi:hypothetical protein
LRKEEDKVPFVTDFTVHGITYQIFVDEAGRFYVPGLPSEHPLYNNTAHTLDELRQALKTAAKDAQLDLNYPFTYVNGALARGATVKVQNLVARRLHGSRRGVVLIKDENGINAQLETRFGSGESILRALSAEEKDELQKLFDARTAAENAVAAKLAEYKIDLSTILYDLQKETITEGKPAGKKL